MLRRSVFILPLGTIFSLCILGAALTAYGEDSHAHHDHGAPPENDFILGDAMQLIAMDFGVLRDNAATLDSNSEAREHVIEASKNAQRYLRIADKRWAPDRAFKDFAAESRAAWHTAQAAAEAGDATAAQSAIDAVGASCKACHEVYREESHDHD